MKSEYVGDRETGLFLLSVLKEKATAAYMYMRSNSTSSSSQFNFTYLVNNLNVCMEVLCLRLVDSFFFSLSRNCMFGMAFLGKRT